MINDAREIAMTACASGDYDKGKLIGYIATYHPTIFVRALLSQRSDSDAVIVKLLSKHTASMAVNELSKMWGESHDCALCEVKRVAEMIGYDTRGLK